MEETANRWLSINEIPQYLRGTSDTIYKWNEKKYKPATQQAGFSKFKKDEVDT